MNDHTITVAQAAEALGVSERTVWRYLRAGRLPGETTGPAGAQRTLIPAASVADLRTARGGADGAALRAERDRLTAALAAAQAERDALARRVAVLQRSLVRPRGALGVRAAGWALLALSRVPLARPSVPR
jgi:excisionase family DNA binding protein